MSAENTNPRLIVKNFGAIKELDIEIKPLTIFIGNQGTGKSTVAKLLRVLNETTSLFPIEKYKNNFDEYNINFFQDKTFIRYYIGNNILINYENGKFKFDLNLEKIINITEDFKNSSKKDIYKQMEYYKFIMELLDENTHNKYIPTERVFISTISNFVYELMNNKILLPKYINNFGTDYLISKIDNFEVSFLDSVTFLDSNKNLLKIDNIILPLNTASSGIQASLPLALVLNHFSNNNKKTSFIIEEPELNLYPTTQKKLVNYLAEKTINKGHELIVTTHSPYILTSFANLIQAGNVAKEKPHLKAELENIVPSQYWLDFDKVGVYYFENGTCRDLLDYENKTIDATAIDDVSEIISKEFDQILDLKYRE